MTPQPSEEELDYAQYTVAILCALDKELLAVRALFDAHHADLPTIRHDTNHYVLGRMGRHNIVSICLAFGEYGTNSAANAVSHLRRSFPNVEVCLLVGIGGGVPSRHHDIRLGDVVVGERVLQYDIGKELEDGTFQQKVTPHQSSQLLRKAVSTLKSDPRLPRDPLTSIIRTVVECRPEYRLPGRNLDVLYPADRPHAPRDDNCRYCGQHVYRAPREPDYPKIHYGLIASGNKVIKSARVRDDLAEKHDVLCFEMEAAGVIHEMPCLVIRGICDYADSHKNDMWQEYASASAAAYARLLLSVVRGSADQGLSSPQPLRSTESIRHSQAEIARSKPHMRHDFQPIYSLPNSTRRRLIERESIASTPRQSPYDHAVHNNSSDSPDRHDLPPIKALTPHRQSVEALTPRHPDPYYPPLPQGSAQARASEAGVIHPDRVSIYGNAEYIDPSDPDGVSIYGNAEYNDPSDPDGLSIYRNAEYIDPSDPDRSSIYGNAKYIDPSDPDRSSIYGNAEYTDRYDPQDANDRPRVDVSVRRLKPQASTRRSWFFS